MEETAITTTSPEQRAALALNSTETERALLELSTKHTSVKDIKDKAGRDQAHGAAMELKRSRVTIERVAKEARDDATKFSRAVIAEEKRLIAIISSEEDRLIGLRDGWDAKVEAERQAKEAAERARVMLITANINGIKDYAEIARQARSSERVADLIAKVTAMPVTVEAFEEFESEAAEAKQKTLASMELTMARLAEEENERARIKAEQEAEAARLESERQAQAKAAAELQAKLDEQAAELARQRAALEAAQAAARAAQAAAVDRLVRERADIEAAKAASEAKPESKPEPVSDQAMPEPAAEAQHPAPTPEAAEPSDDEVMLVAINAVAAEFGMTFGRATQRLAAIQDWNE